MVTITYEYNGTTYRIMPDGTREPVKTVYCNSTDAKPLVGFRDVDRLIEKDTAKLYLFDEDKAGTEEAWQLFKRN